MNKHELKTCPNCHQPFECKSGDIINCQCETVNLEAQHRNYIEKQFNDCLCAQCLVDLRSKINSQQFTQKINNLICQH